jgi:hypothetical protein
MNIEVLVLTIIIGVSHIDMNHQPIIANKDGLTLQNLQKKAEILRIQSVKLITIADQLKQRWQVQSAYSEAETEQIRNFLESLKEINKMLKSGQELRRQIELRQRRKAPM